MGHEINLLCLLFLLHLHAASANKILEFIFGPRLQTNFMPTFQHRSEMLPDHNEAATLASKFGYLLEPHEVTTEDGYMLTLHRLSSSNGTQNAKKQREPVLIQPGLFGSSEVFMFRGPNTDLSYLLSDAGYDVWLVNPRGSHHSRKHKVLNPNADAQYWNFSYHEIGMFDLPACIDYILDITRRKKIFFIGYSMGATAGYVLLSQRPEYNAKFRFAANLAGVGVVVHRLQMPLLLLVKSIPLLTDMCKHANILELFPRRDVVVRLLTMLCRDRSPLQGICLSIIYMITGTSAQFNTINIPHMFTYFPAGSSMNILLHYYQTYTSGFFGPLQSKNSSANSTVEYQLDKITVPMSLHYGPSDILNTLEDNLATASKLSNIIGVFRVPSPEFNHMDFMWGTDAKKLVYDQLFVLMDKYR